MGFGESTGGSAGAIKACEGIPSMRRLGIDLLHFLEWMEIRGQAPSDEDMKLCAVAARELVASPKTRTKAMGVVLTAKLRDLATRRGFGVIRAERDREADAQADRHHAERIAHGLTRADTGGSLPAAPSPPSIALTIQTVILAVPPEQRAAVMSRIREQLGSVMDEAKEA